MVTVEYFRELVIQTGEERRDCDICDPLVGKEWDILDSNLIIPPFDTHPNCRCYLVDTYTGEVWLGEH